MAAAALELAGLRPLVFVVHGHAFLGYWRDEHGPGRARPRPTSPTSST